MKLFLRVALGVIVVIFVFAMPVLFSERIADSLSNRGRDKEALLAYDINRILLNNDDVLVKSCLLAEKIRDYRIVIYCDLLFKSKKYEDIIRRQNIDHIINIQFDLLMLQYDPSTYKNFYEKHRMDYKDIRESLHPLGLYTISDERITQDDRKWALEMLDLMQDQISSSDDKYTNYIYNTLKSDIYKQLGMDEISQEALDEADKNKE